MLHITAFPLHVLKGPPRLADTTACQEVAVGSELPSSSSAGGDGCCHDDQVLAVDTGRKRSHTAHQGHEYPMCDEVGDVHDRSLDVLKRLHTLERLQRTCTLNSAKVKHESCNT